MAEASFLNIRRAGDADLPELVRLLTVLFAIEKDFHADAGKQRRGLALLLREPPDRAALLVACTQDGRPIGMVSAQRVISTAEGASSVWIEDVIVEEGWRGRGVAGRLLDAVLAWAQQQGATRAQLLADRNNLSALDFYRHLGWRPTELGAWRIALTTRA